MGNLTLNGQTVLTQVGTNRPEFGAGVPIGGVVNITQYRRPGKIGTALSSIETFSNDTRTILSVTVTAKLDNSNFFIMTNLDAYNGNSTMRGDCYLRRTISSTTVNIDEHKYAFYKNSPEREFQQHSFMVLDSPNVAKETNIIYFLDVQETGGASTAFGYGDGGGGSSNSITVWEIAA